MKVFCPARLSFFHGPLITAVYNCWCFSVSSLFSSKSGRHEAKREISTAVVLFQMSKPWLVCLLSTSRSLLMCALYTMFRWYLVGTLGRAMSAPSSWKQKSPNVLLDLSEVSIFRKTGVGKAPFERFVSTEC